MKKKRIAIVGIVGLPPRYGGFETLVNFLTLYKRPDYHYRVYCQRTSKKEKIKTYNDCELYYLPYKANGIQSIIYDVVAIIKSWFTFDTILILGTPGCIILPVLRLLKKTNTVVNFGGLEWKRSKWNKVILYYLKFTESIAVKYASHIVADNQYFCDYIKANYNKKSILIEYGGDHSIRKVVSDDLYVRYPFLKHKYDVSVSRAQTDNNLHVILDAYAKFPERKLVLISNYDKFEYGRKLKKQYAGYPNLFLQDAIYDQDELDVIRSNAQLYIHSHSFCGTAPSLVEAMSLELPVIAFDSPTNHFTTEDETFYFKNSDELLKILKSLNNDEISNIKTKMKNIAKRKYTWQRISNAYAELF